MDTNRLKRYLASQEVTIDLAAVPQGVAVSGRTAKFWPYKMAGMLVYGEIPGIRRLPGRLVLAPLPVLSKIGGLSREKVREHLDAAVDLGLLESVEYYSNHALVTAPMTPWESGLLDIDERFAGTESTVGQFTGTGTTLPEGVNCPTHPADALPDQTSAIAVPAKRIIE